MTVGVVMTRTGVVAAPTDTMPGSSGWRRRRAVVLVRSVTANTVTGIVSEADLLRPFREAHELPQERWVSILAEGAHLVPEFLDYGRRDRRTASDLLTNAVQTAAETTSIKEAADLMTRRPAKTLPVLRGRTRVGIVSRADTVRARPSAKPNLCQTAASVATIGAP